MSQIKTSWDKIFKHIMRVAGKYAIDRKDCDLQGVYSRRREKSWSPVRARLLNCALQTCTCRLFACAEGLHVQAFDLAWLMDPANALFCAWEIHHSRGVNSHC